MRITVRDHQPYPAATLVTTVDLDGEDTAHVQRVLWNAIEAAIRATDQLLCEHLRTLYRKILGII